MKQFIEKIAVKNEKASVGDYILHGDVILERIKSLPKGFDKLPQLKDGVLALGEATGHMHKLFDAGFTLREDPKTKVKYLRVVKETALRHQEHETIHVGPGDYRIGIQREYDPFNDLIREVAD